MSQEYLSTFFENLDACRHFVTRLREVRCATPGGGCIGRLEKESADRWVFTLSLGEDKYVADWLSPFEATEGNVATFNRGVADLARRLRIYEETGDLQQVPQQPSPFAELTHPDVLAPEWEQVHQFGNSKTFVDRAGVMTRATGVLTWVRYELNPPGVDKLNNKPVAEMWNCEEYDLAGQRLRVHRMVFRYKDGTTGEPARPDPDWKSINGASRYTLDYLRFLVGGQSSGAPMSTESAVTEGRAGKLALPESDAGLECLRIMHARPMIDEPWTERRPRGFSWIGHRLKQAVDATPMYESRGVLVSRVVIQTPVVSDIQSSPAEVHQVLAKVNQHCIASAYVYRETEREIVATSVEYVHEETLAWRPQQLASFAVIQLCIAEAEAEYLANVTGGQVAAATHATSGIRETPDEMLGALDTLFAVQGRGPSRFANSFEFETIAETAQQVNAATLGATEDGICFEFPFSDYTSLLWLSANRGHRRAGSGLLAELYLPTKLEAAEAADVAAMLNRREAEGESVAGFVGAWCVAPSPAQTGNVVTYREFIPNQMYLAGLIQGVVYCTIHRARWVNRLLNPGSIETNVWEMLLQRHAISEGDARSDDGAEDSASNVTSH